MNPLRADLLRRFFVAAAITVGLSAAVVVLPRVLPFLVLLEHQVSDLRVALLTPPEPQHPDIVVLEITEESLARVPYRSPYDRAILTGVLKKLESAGARAVGMDILFDRQTEPQKDLLLAQTIRNFKVPLIAGWSSVEDGLTEGQFAYQQVFLPPENRGHIILISDTLSGVVRSVSAGASVGDEQVPGFSYAIAEQLGYDVDFVERPLVWRGRPTELDKETFPAFPIHSATLLPDVWFKDKIVLIGADLPDSDRHRTPYAAVFDPNLSNIPGVLIHAQSLAQLMAGTKQNTSGLLGESASVLVMVSLGMALALIAWPIYFRVAAVGLVIVGWWSGAFLAFQKTGLMLPVVMPSLGIAAAYGLGSAAVGGFYRRQQRHIRSAFERYLAPEVVERLVVERRMPEQGGEEREMTVWISDLENYSTYSELLSPPELVEFLNTVYTVMADTIEEYNGFVAQFVGDAVVAAFGAPLDDPKHARHAVESVLVCKARVEALNDEISLPGGLGLRNRYGVSTGPLLVGNIGSKRRLSYSIVGDDINLSSRLEGVNKMYGSTILVNEITKDQCGDGVVFREVDVVRVKGRDTPVRMFEPVGFEADVDDDTRTDMAAFAAALADFRARRFAEAIIGFEALAERDPVARNWAERAREFEQNPPPDDWDAINNLTSK